MARPKSADSPWRPTGSHLTNTKQLCPSRSQKKRSDRESLDLNFSSSPSEDVRHSGGFGEEELETSHDVLLDAAARRRRSGRKESQDSSTGQPGASLLSAAPSSASAGHLALPPALAQRTNRQAQQPVGVDPGPLLRWGQLAGARPIPPQLARRRSSHQCNRRRRRSRAIRPQRLTRPLAVGAWAPAAAPDASPYRQ
jgi:hypothetical protein